MKKFMDVAGRLSALSGVLICVVSGLSRIAGYSIWPVQIVVMVAPVVR